MSDTKEYIIDQAYSLFLSRSYEAVSISEISKAIGFTKGALYHHFSSKEELFKAVIDKYLIINELSTNVENISFLHFIEESIKRAEEIMLRILGEKPAYYPINYMALFIDAFRHYPGFANEKNDLLRSEVEKIKLVLEKAMVNGEIRNDLNASVMAINFFSLAMGIAGNLLHNNSPAKAIESLREQFMEFYKIIRI